MAIPDYVPGPIRDYIYKNNIGGLKSFAAKVGLPYTTLIFTFKSSKHDALDAFFHFCDVLAEEPSLMVDVLRMSDAERRESLLSKIRNKFGSCENLYRTGKVCDQYVQGLMRGECGNKVLAIYVKLASALDMDITDLSVSCFSIASWRTKREGKIYNNEQKRRRVRRSKTAPYGTSFGMPATN